MCCECAYVSRSRGSKVNESRARNFLHDVVNVYTLGEGW